MTYFPNSPFERARNWVQELEREEISVDEFHDRLDGLVQQLEGWYARVQAIRSGPDYPEGSTLVESTKESLQLVYDGVDLLRDFAETRSSEIGGQALEVIEEGSNYLARLLQITEENIQELEKDADY